MGVLGWIVVGFVAGALAKPVSGGGWNLGCLGTIVVGVLGGILGGCSSTWRATRASASSDCARCSSRSSARCCCS